MSGLALLFPVIPSSDDSSSLENPAATSPLILPLRPWPRPGRSEGLEPFGNFEISPLSITCGLAPGRKKTACPRDVLFSTAGEDAHGARKAPVEGCAFEQS